MVYLFYKRVINYEILWIDNIPFGLPDMDNVVVGAAGYTPFDFGRKTEIIDSSSMSTVHHYKFRHTIFHFFCCLFFSNLCEVPENDPPVQGT